NALNKDVLDEYISVFDEIENDKNNASLIIRSDHHKTFCNGLDRDTSGILVFGLSKFGQSHISRQFQDRQTSKIYQALVAGHL
ncbi:pseudouridine synthase, partial [Acinetobacter junii]|uniref:pseudouridine synthase n=1 Tax=Acinetobacter junii TaxID=40215 RepID=UPI001D194C11